MKSVSLQLGVNIDHVATLRQQRGTVYPDPFDAALACRAAGAESLTVHLREDRRHIQDRDVARLAAERPLPLNLEMANAPEIVRLAVGWQPEEVCLVPERRAELTTEGGLDVVAQTPALALTIATLAGAGICVSLFIDPDETQVAAAADLGAPVIELHTGAYCDAVAAGDAADRELERLVAAARQAHALGLRVNAGHGIHLGVLPAILEMPWLHTLNIGHSIVARALFLGLEGAVRELRTAMTAYAGGRP